MIFLSGCVTAPVSTPFVVTDVTQIPILTTPTAPTATITPPSLTITPPNSTPTFVSVSLPDDLVVAYVLKNELWVWKQDQLQLITQQKHMSTPILSYDGQWILFRIRHIPMDGFVTHTSDELWVVRTDGSELSRLVGSDELMTITGKKVLIDYFDWLPGSLEILFNNEELIEGPPGSRSLFDLFTVDLNGQITQLLESGDAGRFTSSPDGMHVALATGSKIKVFNLESGKQETLLEFEPVKIPIDGGPRPPKVVWDPHGRFLLTSILPQNLYYSDLYAGEPEQVWRLFIDGQVELIAQLQPVSPNHAGISVSPNLQYFFYLNGSCSDAMGMLTVYHIESGEEYPLTCVWNLPRWLPDNEHFMYKLGIGPWQIGSISNNTYQPLDILNFPTDPDAYASMQLTWINKELFLFVIGSGDICMLNVATLQGIVTEFTRTPRDTWDICPSSLTNKN